MRTAVTIAGSDSSGGAGIQADIKTMMANGVYAMSAITALTAQNTTGVTGILNATPEFLGQELDCIFTDIFPDAVKIGMVSEKELICVIAEKLKHYQAKNIVVDPVMVATSGARLISEEAVDALKESIREKKRRSHEANADRIAGAALLGMAGANLTAELDNAILDQNADHDMSALRERLRRSKMTMELYCKAGQTTPDEVRAAFRRDAERKMRSILAVQAIAKAEQITVSNAEVDAEYVRLSKLHDTPEAEIRNVLSRDAVASAVTTQKVQRFLIDHANITSVVEKE